MGENILALHKFLRRFQIAAILVLLSAPAAPNRGDRSNQQRADLPQIISSTKI